MPDIYASMILGGESRNVEKLGAYVAWLIMNRLISNELETTESRIITRVRLHDASGADFLSTVLHGELRAEHLTAEGRIFTSEYLSNGNYEKDYAEVDYDGENEWHRYLDLAPKITRRYQAKRQSEEPGFIQKTAKVLRFPGARSKKDND